MIIFLLILACVALYYVGGQSWAHTWFRDLGCPACVFAIATLLFGYHWLYIAGFIIMAFGCSIGDHEKWYWFWHGLVIGVSMVTVAYFAGAVVAVVVAGLTYLVSRFLNKYGVDVILRGLTYGLMPLMVKYILSVT